MSINDFNVAMNLINKYKTHCITNAGSSVSEIGNAEKQLGLLLPSSYKTFLKNFGYWTFEGSEIFGLYNNTIINFTKDERANNENPKFPDCLVVIHALGNGELSCLDTSQINDDEECPVVAWYFGATLPNGKLEVLAEDFGAFLLEKVQWGLESLKEDGGKVNK